MDNLEENIEAINRITKQSLGKSPEEVIDILSQSSGVGKLTTAYSQMLRGINHRGLGNPVPLNRDNSGIVFFTRPNLNLTYDNISLNRMLSPLLTSHEYTIQKYIRCILDVSSNRFNRLPEAKTPLVNAESPFIPLLTNNIVSLSGWPDVAVDTYTSKEGIYKQAYSMVDGLFRVRQPYTLTANFRNVEGDPITAMMMTWVLYATLVKLGDINPYAKYIVENMIDYNTRIYMLVMDKSKQYVTKIASTGAAFPSTVPMGAAFNYTGDQTFVQSTEQISIQFNCNGADYNDPISIYEFNKVVSVFNPGMTITTFDEDDVRLQDSKYVQLSQNEVRKGNYYGTPLIHPINHKLMWFVSPTELESINQTI